MRHVASGRSSDVSPILERKTVLTESLNWKFCRTCSRSRWAVSP